MHGLPIILRLNNPCKHRFDFPEDYPMRPAAVAMEKWYCAQGINRIMAQNAASEGLRMEDSDLLP